MRSRDGELGIALFEDEFIQNPYPLYEEMHQRGDVHRIGDSQFYAVSSWQAVHEAVTRCDDFSSNLTATMMYEPGGTITPFVVGELDPPRPLPPPTNPRTPCTARHCFLSLRPSASVLSNLSSATP